MGAPLGVEFLVCGRRISVESLFLRLVCSGSHGGREFFSVDAE